MRPLPATTAALVVGATAFATPATTCTQLTGELARRLRDDPERHYLNVHSSAHPDGALRGQLHRGWYRG
jgi:hypothetical protein